MATQTILTSPLLYILLPAAAIAAGVWYMRRKKQAAPYVRTVEKIGTPPKNSSQKQTWISPKKLEKKIARLQKRGYRFLRPEETATAAARTVLLVFAGGYRSFYTYAFPVLQKYKIPATVCLAPDLIGTYNRWQDPHEEPWQDLLTPNELNELKKSPLISFGALPLGGQDIAACTPEQAAFAVKESIYRLKNQQGITPSCWSCYPARTLPPERLAALQESGLTLPFIKLFQVSCF